MSYLGEFMEYFMWHESPKNYSGQIFEFEFSFKFLYLQNPKFMKLNELKEIDCVVK